MGNENIRKTSVINGRVLSRRKSLWQIKKEVGSSSSGLMENTFCLEIKSLEAEVPLDVLRFDRKHRTWTIYGVPTVHLYRSCKSSITFQCLDGVEEMWRALLKCSSFVCLGSVTSTHIIYDLMLGNIVRSLVQRVKI